MSPVDTSRPLYDLRGYQRDALAAVNEALPDAKGPWPAVVSPTGSGKTVMFSGLAGEHLAAERGRRVLVGVPFIQLAEQAAEKMHAMVPGARVGIVQGERNEVQGRDIIVGMFPTLANERRREAITGITLGIADECHHGVAPSWLATIGHYADRGAKWVGFTATMSRQTNNVLGDVWEPVYVRDIAEAIADGSVVAPRGIRVRVESLELADVARSRGDLQATDLAGAMQDANAGDAIARAMIEHGPERRWAVFCPDVETAYRWAKDIRDAGLSCETIEGNTPEDIRAGMYARFQSGETQVLTNCMVLTEGWDAPWCDGIVMARPTESAALYVQCVGRGLRPFPAGGKRDCLVLDVVGVTAMHRLATLADLSTSVTKVNDGESLAEAIDREASEKSDALPVPDVGGEHLPGQLVSTVVELFAQSSSVWLKTYRGLWFVPTKAGEVFLAPCHEPENAGLFYLGRAITTKGAYGKTTYERLRPEAMTMDTAMAWAERHAADLDSSISASFKSASDRGAAWRVRKDPPTRAQLEMLAPLIPATRAEASDLISTKLASQRLDRNFAPKRRRKVA